MWHSYKSENISEVHYSLKKFPQDFCMLDLAGKLHEIMDNGLSGIYNKWCWIPKICAQGESIDYSLNYATLAWCEGVIWFKALVHWISQLWDIFWYTVNLTGPRLPLFICKRISELFSLLWVTWLPNGKDVSQSLLHLTCPQQPTSLSPFPSCIPYLHVFPRSNHHLYANGFCVIYIWMDLIPKL